MECLRRAADGPVSCVCCGVWTWFLQKLLCCCGIFTCFCVFCLCDGDSKNTKKNKKNRKKKKNKGNAGAAPFTVMAGQSYVVVQATPVRDQAEPGDSSQKVGELAIGQTVTALQAIIANGSQCIQIQAMPPMWASAV